MAKKIFGKAQKVTCPMPNRESSISIKEAIIGQLHLMREQHVGEVVKIMSVFVGNKELNHLQFALGNHTIFLNCIEDGNYLERDQMEIHFVIPTPTE